MTGIELPLKNKIVRNSIDFRSACGTTVSSSLQAVVKVFVYSKKKVRTIARTYSSSE